MSFKYQSFESRYTRLLRTVISDGVTEPNRTGEPTKSLFAQNIYVDLRQESAPILTKKKIFFDKALGEFRWLWDAPEGLELLHEHGIRWWDDYADDNGSLGQSYGACIRRWGSHDRDQLENIIAQIKENPKSRRHVITLWNPDDLEDLALPNCYTQFILKAEGSNTLNMSVTFRSSDLFLGLPYDVLVLSMYLKEIAARTGLTPGRLHMHLVDAHIYLGHIPVVEEYIQRSGTLVNNTPPSISRLGNGMYELVNYSEEIKLLKAKMYN